MRYFDSLFVLFLIISTSVTLSSVNKIFIFTMNDFHGHFVEGKDEPGIAKFYSALKEFKKELGANDENSILISNGDSHQGTYYADITEGSMVSKLFKAMNVTISSIGNHQFQYGLQNFERWERDGGFPFISANIVWKNGTHFSKPYQIIDINGTKIAFIGSTTVATLYTTSSQQQVEKLNFLQSSEAISSEILKIKKDKDVDFIIALSHIGTHQFDNGDIRLDQSPQLVNIQQLNAIITGHSHQKVAGYLNKKPVIQTCCYAKCLGVLIIDTQTGQITPIVQTINVKYPSIQPDETIDKLVKDQLQQYAQLGNKIVTTIKKDMDYLEIAQLICDKTVEQYRHIGLNFVIINGGLIRIDIQQGDLTMNTLHSIIPFDNTLVFITIRGDVLKKNIEHTKIMLPQRKRGRISGDIQNIKDQQFYKVGVTSFMHPNGDLYSFQSATDVVDTGILIRDLLLKYWKAEQRFDQQL